jgi:hypothetical protein
MLTKSRIKSLASLTPCYICLSSEPVSPAVTLQLPWNLRRTRLIHNISWQESKLSPRQQWLSYSDQAPPDQSRGDDQLNHTSDHLYSPDHTCSWDCSLIMHTSHTLSQLHLYLNLKLMSVPQRWHNIVTLPVAMVYPFWIINFLFLPCTFSSLYLTYWGGWLGLACWSPRNGASGLEFQLC